MSTISHGTTPSAVQTRHSCFLAKAQGQDLFEAAMQTISFCARWIPIRRSVTTPGLGMHLAMCKDGHYLAGTVPASGKNATSHDPSRPPCDTLYGSSHAVCKESQHRRGTRTCTQRSSQLTLLLTVTTTVWSTRKIVCI